VRFSLTRPLSLAGERRKKVREPAFKESVVMRAEAQSMVNEIEESLQLLRRRL
jgi:hypothetical protein